MGGTEETKGGEEKITEEKDAEPEVLLHGQLTKDDVKQLKDVFDGYKAKKQGPPKLLSKAEFKKLVIK